jgi:hypothetical protein
MKRTLSIAICLMIGISAFNSCKKVEKTLPVLVTIPVTDITPVSAKMGGQIAYDGGSDIFERGVCYETRPEPLASGSKAISSKSSNTFLCTMAELIPNTLYYARAYATNSEGTAYGCEVQFTTGMAYPPTVITNVYAFDIYYYQAAAYINIVYDGGAPVTEKGVCWGVNENPTIGNDLRVSNTDYDYYNPDNTIFICWMRPLQPLTTYHVRAYAINSVGISYGNDVEFTTTSVPNSK